MRHPASAAGFPQGRQVVRRIAVAAVLLGAAGQASAAPPAPALLPGAGALLGITQPAEADAALERPFDDPVELSLDAGGQTRETPAHCRALLGLAPRIYGTRPAGDWNVLQQRLADCQALQWLAAGQVPQYSAMPPRLQAVRETRLWPAVIWPAISRDESNALTRAAQTLRTASGRRIWQLVTPGRSGLAGLELASRGYTLRVQWLAHGDFDGDGWEDWLLRWQARVEGGSWRGARSVLLSRKAPAAVFTVNSGAPSR